MNRTLAKIGYAMLTESAQGEISYSNIKWLPTSEAGGREVSAEPKGEPVIIRADGQNAIEYNEKGGYTVNTTLLAIIDDIEEDWLGNTKLADGSILEVDDGAAPPRFALVVAKERFNADTEYEVDTYYNCTAQSPSRQDKTSEETGFDPDFPQYTINAKPRPDNKWVRYTQYLDELPSTVAEPTIPSENDND